MSGNLSTALGTIFEKRSGSLFSGSGLSFYRGVQTKKGNPVNQDMALTVSAFFNGIDIISNDLAKLPFSVMRSQGGRREALEDHPLDYLLSVKPNKLMTSVQFKKVMAIHAILKGNAYAQIIRDGSGSPIALELWDQQIPVEVRKDKSGDLWYKSGEKMIHMDDMLHFYRWSLDGLMGISVIYYAAYTLGIDLSAREFASDYYNSKGLGFGVVTASTSMNDDAKDRYGAAVGDALSGLGSGYKAAVLDEAASFTHLNITPAESEFLMTSKRGVEECARFLNIPIHKLKVMENVNNSIAENQETAHIRDSVEIYAKIFSEELTSKLLSTTELKSKHRVTADLKSLMRTDTKTKGDYFSKAIFSGWMTRNEVRKEEDLNPVEGLDDPLTPVNTQTLEKLNQDNGEEN